jgi:hypothetical protein
MRRGFALLLSVIAVPAASMRPASAEEAAPRTWVAAYRFVAAPSTLGKSVKTGLAAFTLANVMAEDAREVVVEVEPAARVGFGPHNREQAGSVARSSSAVLHVHLLLGAETKGFPVKVSWKSVDGTRQVARVEAFDAVEVQQ